jgi:hypothetical protein
MFESSSHKYNGHYSLSVFFRIYKLPTYVGTEFVMFQAKQQNAVLLLLKNPPRE